jgi:hypothetical protein
MKRNIGGRELLVKAKKETKRRDKRRVKRLDKRHALKLLMKPGVPPVKSPEITALETSNQN